MKIALVSDIHGNLDALRAVFDDIEMQGVDAVFNLGDILSGPLQPAATADFLMERRFPTIAGNHERQLLSILDKDKPRDPLSSDGYTATQLAPNHWDWLRTLPPAARVDDVLLTHGTPSSDLQYLLETVTADGVRAASGDEIRERLEGSLREGVGVIVCGHTHVPRIVSCDGVLVVNPGSVGVQAFEWDRPHPHRIETGAPHARYAVIERRAARWMGRLHAVAYEHERQSEVARGRGFASWAHALSTGRMPAAAERA